MSFNIALMANEKLDKLQNEINRLNNEKAQLEEQIKFETYHEQHEEIKSANTMRSYDWSDAVSELKNAENYDNMMKSNESKLEKLNQQIQKLSEEKKKLSQKR
jgi:uncharacterized protein (UPF0335 family)